MTSDERQITVIEELLRMQERIDKAPPTPAIIYARYDVPPGAPKRMWDTKGRLIWYVQRAYIDQLPKAEPRDSFAFHQPLGITWGVPIQFEGPEAHMHIAHDGTPKLYTAR